MKFKLEGEYRSLSNFESPDFSNLTILTGLNGSGKTQFLQLINTLQNKSEHSALVENHQIKFSAIGSDFQQGNIKLVHLSQLVPKNIDGVNKQVIDGIKSNIWQQYQQRNRKVDYQYLEVCKKIAKTNDKDYNSLVLEDIQFYKLTSTDLGSPDMFQLNLGQLFVNYAYNLRENRLKTWENEKYNTKHEVLSEEEFKRKYTNPWELINKMLEVAQLDYQIKGIEPEEYSDNITYQPKYKNKISGAEIDSPNLSSGEKVLMSLAFCLFNSQLNFESNFPVLLLLDEPDASLHPLMTKQFLDIIENVLIKEKNIKVIMTTHSPSTIAIAPEVSIYAMNKTGQRIRKISKDAALKMLTAGIPTLSIDYEKRKQVFVESNIDRQFYEKCYHKSEVDLHPDISLHFISSGIEKVSQEGIPDGDCNRVSTVVNELVKGGNKDIFGIIDWDKKNNGNSFVKVIGKGARYNIENYIYDPILLTSLLLDYQIINRSDLSIGANDTYIDFKNFDNSQLQLVADFIINKIKLKINPLSDLDLVQIEYLNSRTIQIPKWYLMHHGHKLEKEIIEIFPKLKSEFKGNYSAPEISEDNTQEEIERLKKENLIKFNNYICSQIKNKIINKIIDNIPHFITKDLIELLKEIQYSN